MFNKESKSQNESEIFNQLAVLAETAGYAHVVAAFCFRDNTIGFSDEIMADDIVPMYSREKLARTEISTLIGLMIQGDIDLTLPDHHQLQYLLNETERLLSELHKAMISPMITAINDAVKEGTSSNPFLKGSVLRECIFYGGESAYNFQYRDLAVKKYHNDNDWLRMNKGFSIEDARAVVNCIELIQNDKILKTLEDLQTKTPQEWTMLPAYVLSTEEIASRSGIDSATVSNILRAFTVPINCKNVQFRSIGDFNIANAYPLIPLDENEYLLFQSYSLSEALYETPFYWMVEDKAYQSQAMTNRGAFTEEFCAERLRLVFGDKRVFKNVLIVDSKNQVKGEIDVLVVFANRAIVLQAKSKRLTIEARKGNDNQIKDDFKRAIQDSYDQGLSCAELLSNNDHKFIDNDSTKVQIPGDLKEIFILCVISDHYPSLAFQTHQFLTYSQNEKIAPPFVMDIFLLDVMTEMLHSPLHLLAYINRRSRYNDKILSSQELTILSYHLKHNLWLDPDYQMFYFDDDICADLDVAMMARREGVSGKITPDGILTRLNGTFVGDLIRQIEENDNQATIELGFFLLTLSEDTVREIDKKVDEIVRRAKQDRQHHDFTMMFKENSSGLTIHCNNNSLQNSLAMLNNHCQMRKYIEKADNWYGVCIEPFSKKLRFGISMNFPWVFSKEMDDMAKIMPKSKETYYRKGNSLVKKIGRNEPCPCGSGRKFKKCCLNK